MMSARVLPLTIVLLLTGIALANPLPFKEQYNLRERDHVGRAELMLSQTTVAEGGSLVFDFRYHNRSSGCKLFNPFFNRLLPLPAKLAVFDADKKYVMDLIHRSNHVSRRWPGEGDWAYLPGRGYIGKETMYPVQLKPGKYYVQIIYLRLFITERRANRETDDDVWSFAVGEDVEVCRSNVVEIEVVRRREPAQR